MKQKDEVGVSERSRDIKSFEPSAASMPDSDEDMEPFEIECDVEIYNDNAEEEDY